MLFSLKEPRVRFNVSFAGIPIEVYAFYRSTKCFCKDFYTGETPLYTISLSRDDIEDERRQDIRQAKSEGRAPWRFANRHFETLALCRKVASLLFTQNILLFHGAVMAYEGKAYLFTAKSGVGKTTHCRLWLKTVPGCHILNGDKPFLLFREDTVYACSGPWRGKEGYGVNETLPLEAICLLERDTTNHICPITLKDGLQTLLRQFYIPSGEGNCVQAMRLLNQFASVRLYRLGCNMEDEAALLSYRAMVKNMNQ